MWTSMMQMMWNILVYWTRQLTFCVRLVISRPAVTSQDQSLVLGLENLTWTQVKLVVVTISAEGLSQRAVLCLVAQSCLTLQPHGLSLPDSSVHGILQARILEWVAMPFSRGASQPSDRTQASHIAGRFSTIRATKEAPYAGKLPNKPP